MKVKFRGFEGDEAIREDLTIDNVYKVIEDSNGYYRVMTDDGLPTVFKHALFTVVDPSIPDDWITIVGSDGETYRSHPDLLKPGFYSDYFEGKPYAILALRVYLQRWLLGKQ